MLYKPNLDDYDLNRLIALGNMIDDEYTHNNVRNTIARKLYELNYPMFSLIIRFKNSKMILREAYADVILMNMKNNDYFIDDLVADEILEIASYDAVMYYGADSNLYEFNIKCKEEYYRRGLEIEDKIELQRKRNLGKKLMLKLNKKKKGDKND